MVTHETNQTSMQAHGQEEMFMGHNQVGFEFTIKLDGTTPVSGGWLTS